MSSRALSLATVLLLIGFGAADSVFAQATNLEAGKTPSQLFAQTCNVCHKSPRGLLKSVPPGSLPGFLRQHYTTSSDMAGLLANYLISNGATDTRYQAKDGKKDGAKDKEATTAPAQSPEHQGRRQRSQDAAGPEGAKPDGQAAPEARKGKRRAKPGAEEAPKVDAAVPATEDKKTEPKPETVKPDSARAEPDSGKGSDKASEKPVETKPDSARVAPAGNEASRPDPVPQVTPAAPAAAKPAEPAAPKPAEEAASKPAAPAASSEPAAKPRQEPAPPAAAAAPTAPAASSGPPAPPISR